MFCPCVFKKYTATTHDHNNKLVHINVQKRFSQRGARGIFIGFDHHTPGYLVFIPSTRQIVTSVDIIFDKYFLSALVHKSRAYREALLTRPINDITTDPNDVTDHTGDISTSSFLPLVPSAQIEEEEITIKNTISPEDTTYDATNKRKTKKMTTSLPVGKSTRIKKQNNKYDTHEWVSLAKEINEEEEPWENYGDPNLFIPEPKGLCTILKLKQKDPTAFKLWSRAIRAEIKNLITQGTFVIENPEKE